VVEVMTIETHPIKDRASWLEMRRRAVTASEVAALFGFHSYKTAFQLYIDKTADLEPAAENDAMRRGRILEDGVAKATAEIRPSWKLEKADHYLFRPLSEITLNGSKVTVGQGATPDYYIECPKRGRGILQAKTVLPDKFAAEWTEDLPPMWIIMQVQQEMLLSGLSWGAIGALVVDPYKLPLYLYELDAHMETQARLTRGVDKFWLDVAVGKAPNVDFNRDTEIIKSLHRQSSGEILDLTGNNRINDLLFKRKKLKDQEKEFKPVLDELKAIDTEIRSILGDAYGATLPGWEIMCPVIQRKGYSVDPTSYRQLRIKQSDE
jgi:predicted phage-related endonuclease